MNKNIKHDLVTKKVREKAGAISSNRFDYQKDWAICKIIELDEKGMEYAIIMEHHEDVVTVNPFSDPKEIHFFQIKTSNKNWTLQSLTKKESNLSIIGKMADSHKLFPYGDSFSFCSNSPYSLSLKDSDNKSQDFECLSINLINEDEIKKIKETLRDDGLSEIDIDNFLQKLILIRLKIDKSSHCAIAKAKLIDFIEKKYGSIPYRPGALYKTLFEEVKRKTNYEDSVGTYDELVDNKGITKSQFSAMIQVALANSIPKIIEIRNFLQNKLNFENAPLRLVASLLANLQSIYIDRQEQNIQVQKLLTEVVNTVGNLTSEELDLGLWVNIKKISGIIGHTDLKSKEYIYTSIGLSIYERLESSPSD
ncbi:PF14130 domain protein [Leptospira interrogans str. 2003000735]|uniref:PF14130 domain protein n=4 Tax=Leptospira interrogans TaxID=173 RepID=N1UJT8_LEPIR|nr:dsDNA nuclease domain-containing protein [Leptospira interrogans]EMY26548.1 PF14130 domain protein [Leptospira interrogans serovar Australis str. 200703203]EKN90266.1 PF14130 domain protein [Leptospira interrogans str. 2002000624]EKQ36098.1 PF14130 domain protein [Leptospira interrogans str. 2002000621]EKQ50102.1 PF14130 domain protein [Leptospira interrogans str. 2002000623]EMJ71274.1 PF14130 domain protein [Leptospira interrogans str. 2002000632]